MAIDSKDKRNSAFLDPWGLPFPQGAIGTESRQTFLGMYTGLAAAMTPFLGDVLRFRVAIRRVLRFRVER